jgi:hypothetical protein
MDRKDKPVEWLGFWKIAHLAPNYLHDHNDVCTYNETYNHIQRENKEYTVFFVGFVSHDHGELPDHVAPFHNSIIDVFGLHSLRTTLSLPIKKVPKIIISASHLRHKKFIKLSVTVTLHHGGLALIDWNPTQVMVNSVVFAVVFKTVCILAYQTIYQWNKFDYLGVSNHKIEFLKTRNKVVVMIILVPLLSSKRKHDTNESTSLGCHLIGRNLHHPDTTSKQWSQQKICIHLKQLLFYSWDTGDLIRPAEEWGEKGKT